MKAQRGSGPSNLSIKTGGGENEMDEVRLNSPDQLRMYFDSPTTPTRDRHRQLNRSHTFDCSTYHENYGDGYREDDQFDEFRDLNCNRVGHSGLSDLISSPESTLPTTDRSSRASIYSRRATLSCLGIVRPDSLSAHEKRMRLQSLLTDIYDEKMINRNVNPYRCETESITDTTMTFSDHSTSFKKKVLNKEKLERMDIEELKEELDTLYVELEYANTKLVRAVKQRCTQKNRVMNKCAIVSAVLQAFSEKKRSDSHLKFSVCPSRGENGFEEWKNAMRAVGKLPGGVPAHFRKNLWTALADQHISTLGVSWESICGTVFCDKVLPEDEQLTSQIIKDLHRTGWAGFNEETEQLQLKRVLLGYARYNKDVGYCQGFNVIAALILQTVDYKPDVALKILIFLLEQVLPCGYFDQSLRALSVDMAVLRDLLHQRLPKTIQHMENLQHTSENEFEPPLLNVFSMNWLLTLYATCLPSSCVYRIWDAVMLEGSEVLLRTSLAIWARLSRKIVKTQTADEFYSLMETLCKQLQDMRQIDEDNLLSVIYSMCEFPYPGLSDLRDKYTWNIQPLSDNFRLFQKSVRNILGEETNDDEPTSSTCSPRRSKESTKKSDLQLLQKQYNLMRDRQKQASLILKSAYDHGQRVVSTARSRCILTNPLVTQSNETLFNHLQMGQQMVNNKGVDPPSTISGGALSLTPTIVQPITEEWKAARLRLSPRNERVVEREVADIIDRKETRDSVEVESETNTETADSGRDSDASTPSSERAVRISCGGTSPSSSSCDECVITKELGNMDMKEKEIVEKGEREKMPQKLSSSKKEMIRRSKAMIDAMAKETPPPVQMMNPFKK